MRCAPYRALDDFEPDVIICTMVTPNCPRCNRVILSDDINVAKDVAYCRGCNVAYSLGQLTHRAGLEAGVDLNRPPAGAWSRNDGGATVIGATHRSLMAALGGLFISLFWNGIVSVFVCLALVGTLQHMSIPIPHWFPMSAGKGDLEKNTMPLGLVIFLWLFLTPFIAIGLGMIATSLSAMFGRTEVRIGNSEGTLFSGIGPVGRRRRFDPKLVKEVRIEDTPSKNNTDKTSIVIETREGKLIRFGSMLKDTRRKFVAAAVSRALH